MALFGSAGSRRIRGRRPLLLNCATSPHIKGGEERKLTSSELFFQISDTTFLLSMSPSLFFNFVHFQPAINNKTRGVDPIWNIGLAQRAGFVQKAKSKEEKR